MTSTFSRKPAYFEKKSQIAPNSVIFNDKMSDSTVRLILALNGLPDNWTVVQCDIQKRLNWGKDKMRAAIKEATKFGYLQVSQRRVGNNEEHRKKGQFYRNHFEFDISASYICDNKPCGENPSTALSNTEEPPIPYSSYESNHLKEDKKTEDEKTFFFSSIEDKEKLALVFKYDLAESFQHVVVKYSIEDIRIAVEAVDRWSDRKLREGKEIDFPTAIIAALRDKWKPTITVEDIKFMQQEEKRKKHGIIEDRKKMVEEWKKPFFDHPKLWSMFTVTDYTVCLKLKNGYVHLNLEDDETLSILERFIKEQVQQNQ